MHLKSLEISGFKSFAKKSELEFSSPITAIVGPNGSGKSNVAEAFRFVLGEQSIKSMRGKRGEDLIFNGSATSGRGNRASVKVTLDNSKRHFNLDYDEITVERSVHRDGVNEYHINGSQVRLKDVTELLAQANIGSTGHHIISQGEADRVLSASIRERREMIEDALGLKVFQYKKQESERKLKKTRENIAQVESLRKEVAPHLRFLKRQVDKVEKSLQLREELKTVYKEYLKREDEYLAYHQNRLVQEKEVPQREYDQLSAQLEKLKQTLAHTEKADKEKNETVELEQMLRSVRGKKDAQVKELGRIEGQVAFIERRIETRKRNATHDDGKTVPLKEIRRLVSDIKERARNVTDTTPQDGLWRTVRALVEVSEDFLARISLSAETSEEAQADTQELAKLAHDKKSAEATLHQIEKEEEHLNGQYNRLKREVEEARDEGREAEREMFSVMTRQNELQGTLNTIERDTQRIERDRVDFKRELQEAVALIGRDATQYFDVAVTDKNGERVTQEMIIAEERDVQLERRRTLERMKIRLEELGGANSEEIMKEYKEVSERDVFLEREIEDLEKSALSLETLIKDLDEQLNTKFFEGIKLINTEFNRFFTLMFGGGSATLTIEKEKRRRRKQENDLEGMEEEEEDDEDAYRGIDIDVKLPHKKVRGLEMLSGGERALTSIALIFAMSQVNPPLFIILDETDAALDEANSRRYGDMVTSLAEKSQLILITHNRETMSRAGVLYGITMGSDGISKLLSVKFDEAVAVAK